MIWHYNFVNWYSIRKGAFVIKKSYWKYAPQANPGPIFNFGSHYMPGILLQIRYFKRGLPKRF